MNQREKVDLIRSAEVSNRMKIINLVADKYKGIAGKVPALADDQGEVTNFSHYFFMTSLQYQELFQDTMPSYLPS